MLVLQATGDKIGAVQTRQAMQRVINKAVILTLIRFHASIARRNSKGRKKKKANRISLFREVGSHTITLNQISPNVIFTNKPSFTQRVSNCAQCRGLDSTGLTD